MPAVIREVAARGFGANVVSRGEWARGDVGPASRTTGSPWRASARPRPTCAPRSGPRPRGHPLRWIALESPEEAAALAAMARARRVRLDVLYRLNPDVAPETLAGLAVGAGASKFGMDETAIAAAVEAGGGPDGPLRPRGIHLHVGSQLGAVDAWREAVRKGLALTALWRGSIDTFDTLDLGGGFPVRPLGEPSPDAARFARELPALLEAIPGRPPTDTPRHRTGTGPRRPRRLARWPASCTSASAAGRRSSSTPA